MRVNSVIQRRLSLLIAVILGVSLLTLPLWKTLLNLLFSGQR